MAEQPQRNKIFIIAILAVVLAVVMARQFGVLSLASKKGGGAVTPAPGSGASGAATPDSAGVPMLPPALQMPWKRPDAVGPIARDPMHMDLAKQLPPEKLTTPDTSPGGTEFSVAGIIFSTEQPSSAIIDGRILHEGDAIYGAAITRINEDSVEFRIGDKRWTVRAGERTVSPE